MTADTDLSPAADRRLRDALDAAATTAPVAPGWEAIHARVRGDEIVPAPSRLRRRPVVLVAAVVLLLLVAGAGVVALATRGDDTVTADGRGDAAYCGLLDRPARARLDVRVYLEPDAPADAAGRLESAIAATGHAEDLVHVDRDAAYAEARQLFADSPTMQELLRAEDMPTSFRLTVADAAAADAVMAALGTDPAVYEIVDDRSWRPTVLDVLAGLADGAPRLADRPEVDDDLVAAIEASVPAAVEAELATAIPAFAPRSDLDVSEPAATLVADADRRCDLSPNQGPTPADGPGRATTDGATTSTEPG